MMRLPLVLVLGLALAIHATAGAAESIVWKLGSGEVLRYRMVSDQRAKQTVVGAGGAAAEPVETRQQQTIVWRLSVVEVDPKGIARIVCRYDSIAVDMEQMMLGRIAWDSTKREDATRADDPIVKPFSSLVGKEFHFGMTADGHVVDVRGFDKIRDALLAGLEDNPFAKAALTSGFGEDATRAALERAFAFVPPKPVDVGATWSSETEQAIPLLGTVKYTTDYKLEEAAKITGATKLSVSGPPPADPGMKPLAEPIEIEWKGGDATSTIQFSIEKGRLTKSDTRARMALRSKVKPPVAPTEGANAIAADVSIEQTTTVELLD